MKNLFYSQAFLPLLKKAASNYEKDGMSINRAAIVNMTSILGSIGDNTQGGYYPYRCSKVSRFLNPIIIYFDLFSQ